MGLWEIVVLLVFVHQCITEVTVSTSVGEFRGNSELVLDTEVNVFLGIPFAKPPVGELRFKRPEPAEPIVGVFDAFTLQKTLSPAEHLRLYSQEQQGGRGLPLP